MLWPRRAQASSARPEPLATPLEEVEPGSLDVIEIDAAGRLAGLARWKDDDSLREVPYAAGARDPGSLAGVWEGLARS